MLVVERLNSSMYVFVSMILVYLHMEILLTSVTPCGLRCSLISSREHNTRSEDFITPFEKLRVGWGHVFMFSFPNCFYFSIFSDCFWFVVCIIMVLFIDFWYWLVYSVFLLFFESGLGIVWWLEFLLLTQVQWIDRSFHQFRVHFLKRILRGVFLFFLFLLVLSYS